MDHFQKTVKCTQKCYLLDLCEYSVLQNFVLISLVWTTYSDFLPLFLMKNKVSSKSRFFLDFSWSFSNFGDSGDNEWTMIWRWCSFEGEKKLIFRLFFHYRAKRPKSLGDALFGPLFGVPVFGAMTSLLHSFVVPRRLTNQQRPNSDSHPRHSKDTWTFSPCSFREKNRKFHPISPETAQNQSRTTQGYLLETRELIMSSFTIFLWILSRFIA